MVARVRGVHGLRGLVRVEVLTDHPDERFVAGGVLHREGSEAPLTITSSAPIEDGPGWRLGFREVRDRTGAERLRDAYLEMAVERGAELAPGEAYWHEVIGAEVRSTGGELLGRVADIYRAGETEVYVVRGEPFGEFDVPAVRSIVTSFDPRGDGIVVDEAVLDLQAKQADPMARPPRKIHHWSRHGKTGQPATGGVPPTNDGDGDSGPEAA